MKSFVLALLFIPLFSAWGAPTNYCLNTYGQEFKALVNESLSNQFNEAFKAEFIKIYAKDGITINSSDIVFNVGSSASYIYKSKIYYSHQFYFEVPEVVSIKVNNAVRNFKIKTWYEDETLMAAIGYGNIEPEISNGMTKKSCNFTVSFYDSMFSSIYDESTGEHLAYLEPSVKAEFHKIIAK